LGSALPTFNLIEELQEVQDLDDFEDDLDTVHKGFVPKIELQDITFTYPGSHSPAISNICLSVPPGTSVAIVGSSGSGKTTLIDLLLGVLLPDIGKVLISGYSPADAVVRWPGAISYVPQDVIINSGTVRENVALGYPISTAKDGLVLEALNVAHLTEFVSRLPKGLDTEVGEKGSRISGGQRQRLGIARAMFTKPNLLVLDEATSSLDGETEANVSEAIHSLRGLTTVVVIAHRLSTVKSADLVLYIDGGKIVAKGTFEEVRKSVSDFDKQARLLGL
jgi:ABC-type bacteriocin/lantibiotic exporter with double-glycine peptidase domain